jgi:hypothetical protein
MFLLDSLLIGGLRFVLDKVAAVADSELNDDSALREHLLAAQMRVELGEMTQAEFEVLEADILQRLREIRERQLGQPQGPVSGDYTVTGIDVSFDDDDSSRS